MSERTDFIIIGIGASAGGLEALQEFFSKLPNTLPAAFVVIQHLSSDFKSMMDEVLSKFTRIPVKKVSRPTKVRPNYVYLTEPKKNLELVGNTLTPRASQQTDKPGFPIDLFFDSLGKYRRANSIGIILSGTGTDGSRGIKTIKAQGGIIMVQAPESAIFDGMPNAALRTGLADFVLRLPEMAQEVTRIIHHPSYPSTEATALPTTEKDYLNEILQLVADETRLDFDVCKETTILGRIQKRMHITHVDTLKDYYQKLANKPAEVTQLVAELLMGVSSIFQDESPWQAFRDHGLLEVVQQPASSDPSTEKDSRFAQLKKELDEQRRITHFLREKLETHTEELLATNEELQNSNEELQTVNEELHSVNTELLEKINEVTLINNDMVNLLNSTEIPTIFVNQNFLIRRFTSNISKILNINEKDIGRSVEHFTEELPDVSLMSLAHEVMETGQPIEREVLIKSGNCSYLMRILPYRTTNGSVDGLVITFVDITEVKEAKLEVQNARTFAENIVNSVMVPLLILNDDLTVVSANPAFYATFATTPIDTENQSIYELDHGQWNQPELHRLLDNIIPGNSLVTDYPIEYAFPDIGSRSMALNAITIPQLGNIPSLILLTIRDITEKEQNRKQMLETTKRLNMVVQISKMGTWEWDIKTQEVTCDQRTRELFDLPPEESLTFEQFAARVHKEDYSRVYQSLSDAVEHNKTYSADFRVVLRNGEVRHMTGYASLLHTDQGEPYKLLGVNTDITERKRSEENIAHYGRLLEESHNEIYVFDAETLHYVNVNRGAQKNLGYSLEELTSLTPLDLKPEFDQKRFAKLIEPLQQGTQKTVTFETVHRRKNGSLYNVLVNLQSSIFFDHPVFIAIVQDTTEQANAKKQLRQNEERLGFALNGTSDGIWDWPDMQQDNAWWSPRLYQLLGLRENELAATFSNFTSLVHPNDRDARQKAIDAHILHGKPFDVTVRLKHKTDGYRWFRSRGQVIRDHEGKPVRMAGVVSDIHNQKLAENKLKKTNRDLRIANEYLDNFVFTAAHDLRAPVANLKSLAGLLQTQKGQDNRVVEKIDQSIDRLENTLRGLIKILDIQQTDRKEHARLSFKKVLEKVLIDLEQQIDTTKANISYDFEVKSIQYVEPYLISIFRNLLSNALKFSGKERSPQIHIKTTDEKSYVCLAIKDNGVGIDLERFRKRLFKAFERLSRSGNGLGIGLHIVKTIVEKNDGFIEVQSEVDQGTTFLVYLKPYNHEEENIAH